MITPTVDPMTAAVDGFVEHYHSRAHTRTGEPVQLRQLREAALAQFTTHGVPTRKLEWFKHTSLRGLATMRFAPIPHEPPRIPFQRYEDLVLPKLDAIRFVFIDGMFSRNLSDNFTDPAAAALAPIRVVAAKQPKMIEDRLAGLSPNEGPDHALTALNTALFHDGTALWIKKGQRLAKPVHIVHVSAAGRDEEYPVASHPRTLIVAAESSEATIIESFVALDGSGTFTNAVSEIYVGENAQLTHIGIQRENNSDTLIHTLDAEVARAATFTSHNVSLGGPIVRKNLTARLVGEGAHANLFGLAALAGRHHVDHHTRIDHVVPNCTAREVYKNILDDRSHAVFYGRIVVHQDAQQTDAKQSCGNLLLSDDAVVDVMPQLEIYADDVKCAHGATTGRLDDAQLFYLQSRGIPADLARRLLTYAFASELLDLLKLPVVRTDLEAALLARFGHTAGALDGASR